jgi:acetoacetyl-CoA synthetase
MIIFESNRKWQDERIALISAHENGLGVQLTYSQLYEEVRKCSNALRSLGVKTGDTVAGYISNIPEAVVSMLAVASIGAIWTSCSPELGPTAVLDRFQQVNPKVLFSIQSTLYNGKEHDHFTKLKEVVSGLTSLVKVVIVGNQNPAIPNAELYTDFVSGVKPNVPLVFEQLPFDTPLFIVYSSGTTGKPKCIVHSAGGALIQHLKEHKIHGGLTRDDMFFQYTTTACKYTTPI